MFSGDKNVKTPVKADRHDASLQESIHGINSERTRLCALCVCALTFARRRGSACSVDSDEMQITTGEIIYEAGENAGCQLTDETHLIFKVCLKYFYNMTLITPPTPPPPAFE